MNSLTPSGQSDALLANKSVSTTCPYCGVGCGVAATQQATAAAYVAGLDNHPANFGKLCSKGSTLGQTLDHEGRLLQPQIAGQAASWDSALDLVAEKFSSIIAQHGPDSVAFYVSGQLLTEDYYIANKLMKGYIGSANIDTNSRLCMSSAVAAHKRAFGADIVPGNYEDLELCNLLVLTGSNTAWCHPILFQRFLAAKRKQPNKRMVCIDPRRTATAEQADLHLAIKAGTDVALFNGLLAWLADQQQLNHAYIDAHTEGFDEALNCAKAGGDVALVAEICGLDVNDLLTFYQWFAEEQQTVTMFSQGVNQSSSGTDKGNAIINCHLATGRVGQPGASPFSITGQPNAMGGREVGGLANMLAAHMDFDQAERVQRFWNSPSIATRAGLKAVDMFDALAEKKIKAIWIMATNPAVSMPNAAKVNAALADCEFVVVSDVLAKTDTTRHADVLLPATGWGEKDGTVSNSERRISRQRAFLPAAGEARADWQIMVDVAQRMGFAEGFNYQTAAEVFREHAQLSAFENNGERDFNLAGLAALTEPQYQQLQPLQWPVVCEGHAGTERMLADGQFFTDSKKARFIGLRQTAAVHSRSRAWPLILNTGRLRDHWHTMTRTGKSATLSAHRAEPLLAVSPADAARYALQAGQFAQLQSEWGSLVARVEIAPAQRAGEVFMPIHWSDQFASSAVVGRIVNPVVDRISGEPEFKHTPVRVTALPMAYQGFIISRQPIQPEGLNYWVQAKAEQCWRSEFAVAELTTPLAPWAQQQLSTQLSAAVECDDAIEWLQYSDSAQSVHRLAAIQSGQVLAVLVVAAKPEQLPSRAWLLSTFGQSELSAADRRQLLSGEPADPAADVGAIVCSCFAVGKNSICRAIADGASSVTALGDKLRCGTNCGSCVPELEAIVKSQLAELPKQAA